MKKYLIILALSFSPIFCQLSIKDGVRITLDLKEQISLKDNGYSEYMEELLSFIDYFDKKLDDRNTSFDNKTACLQLKHYLRNILHYTELSLYSTNMIRLKAQCEDSPARTATYEALKLYYRHSIIRGIDSDMNSALYACDILKDEVDYNTSTWFENCRKLLVKIRDENLLQVTKDWND